MMHLLDKIFWHALTGPHAKYATGTHAARRYAPGFSPNIAFENEEHPDLASLAPFCEPGEQLYSAGWSGTVPEGWRVEAETAIFRMVWDAQMPETDEAPDAARLAAQHVPQMLALTALTHPGPFGPRTIELGEYFGCFDGERLIAMAGERVQAGTLREVSGVCTHPDAQGRGLARRLMLKLVRRQMQRGETPCLNVLGNNTGARRLYARMGFRDNLETVVRVVSRT